MQRVYVTGAAGFIGFHLSELLLKEGLRVHGYDGMTAYYDLALKRGRLAMLHQREGFGFTQAMLEDNARLAADMAAFKPDVVVHLAAQAGVRYSLEAPRSYLSSNIEGTFNVMEAARDCGVKHLLLASTSSVYGANTEMPYRETDKADTQVSLYAATKKATESLSHSWAHLWGLPTTCFRFFTVYGPWGRPDMAPFKFTKAILQGETIDVYGHGRMFRDFTYVTDLVRAIRLLMDKPPNGPPRRTRSRRATASRPSRPGASSTSATARRWHSATSLRRSRRRLAGRPSATSWKCRRATCPRHGPTTAF